jgi:hypothetical protein
MKTVLYISFYRFSAATKYDSKASKVRILFGLRLRPITRGIIKANRHLGKGQE